MDTKNTAHPLLFTYLGIIMHFGFSLDDSIDALSQRLMGFDYEDHPKGMEENARKAIDFMYSLL